jgi:hypothetical protein
MPEQITPTNQRTVLDQIADLLKVERWKGQDAQAEYDRRIVEYAVKNGFDPLHALTGKVFVIGQAAVDQCRKGLDL